MPYARLIASMLLVALAGQLADASHLDFAVDPAWEGQNNLPHPDQYSVTVQDFGYSTTQHNGADGEIGGHISRSLTPATYQKSIPTKTLEDRLQASGTFVVPACGGGSGVLMGWFNADSAGWRTPNSLVFRIDSDGNRYRVFFEYGTQAWGTGSGATFEKPYQEHRDDVVPAGPQVHEWALGYDPTGAQGAGAITFVLDGKRHELALDAAHRAQGARFNRFGLMNVQSHGDALEFYVGNLTLDGEAQDLTQDPQWDASGNRTTFKDFGLRPVHDFGWRNTSFAGGAPGEIGGRIWRVEQNAPETSCAYGSPVQPLNLDSPLRMSGKVTLRAAASDSALAIGWYSAADLPGGPPANCLGVLVEGPSAVGHYFRPLAAGSQGATFWAERGPVILPDAQTHTWSFAYGPEGTNGGTLQVTLDEETYSVPLPEDIRSQGAAFDHFGVFSWLRGGHFVEMYFDDLTFTDGATP